MGLEYVDIFYSHRFDPDTPLEETMGALADAVRQGKAIYIGISNYDPDTTRRASEILEGLGVPCVIHQARYSLLDRWVEKELLQVLEEKGIGCIAFSPLAQGLLTDKYLTEIPTDSRAARPHGFLQKSAITPQLISVLKKLNHLAAERKQTLAQMSLAWVLKDPGITSVLIGARNKDQLLDSLKCTANTDFSAEESLSEASCLGSVAFGDAEEETSFSVSEEASRLAAGFLVAGSLTTVMVEPAASCPIFDGWSAFSPAGDDLVVLSGELS
jgi:L-glyceraldehyde 3-phosphate reductase